ncbi:uncharacterized protein LOC144054621 [Vanacampus margaritifer]
MQHYQLRGHEMTLLGELQRQQHSTQFCDTLLQTEGISVPTHSCVLAALSPYLSQKLSATPSPPSGQKRKLQLQSLKAHTLLKLVGLLYSGELVVKGSVEEKDVMDAVQKFGITPLIERQTSEATKEVQPQESQVGSCSKCCAFKVAGRESSKCTVMKDAQVQHEMSGRNDGHHSLEKRSCVSTGTQTPLENLNTKPVAPDHITIQPKSSSHQPSASVTKPMLNSEAFNNHTCSSNNDTSFSQRPQQECSDSTGSTNVLTQTKDNSKTSRDRVKKMSEGKHVTVRIPAIAKGAKKNMAKMKLMESASVSVKVKLRRRRTQEKLWEVVTIQDEDEAALGFAPLSQESHQTAAQTPHAHVTQTEPGNSIKLPPPPNTTSEPLLHFNDCTAPHQNGTLQSALVQQPLGLAEESDEQIEKLLEDIMMGLNILPDLGVPERDTGQSKTLSVAPSPERQYHQNIVEQSAHRTTYRAQNQVNRKCAPLVDPSGAKIPLQPQDRPSVRSADQTGLLSHRHRRHPPFQEMQSMSSGSPPWWNDLRLPRCLSPLSSLGIDDPTTSNRQLSRFERPLLTEQSGLLVFPLTHGEDKRPPLLKTHRNCWPMQCLKQLEYGPQQTRNRARPCIKNMACPTAAERKCYPKNVKRAFVHRKDVAMDDTVAPKKRKVHVDYPQDVSGSTCDGIESKKNLSICSVSLSQNNVLSKERQMATSSLKSRSVCLRKRHQQSTTNTHQKERTRTTGPPKPPTACQNRIKTRSCLKTAQVPPSDTCTQNNTDANSEVQRPPVASKRARLIKKKRERPATNTEALLPTCQTRTKTRSCLKTAQVPPSDTDANSEVQRPPVASKRACLIKQKPGTTSKTIEALFSPNTASPGTSSENQKRIEEELLEKELEKSNTTKGNGLKMRKRRRKEMVTLKNVESAAKADDNKAPKRRVAFREFQTFLKGHNFKKKSSKSQDVAKTKLDEDVDIIQLQEECPVNVNVSDDQILNGSTVEKDGLQQGSGSSSKKESAFFRDEQPSVDVVQQSFAQHTEMDQTQKNHVQGKKFVVMSPKNYNPGCSLSDSQPCRQNQMTVESNVNPQISPHLSAATEPPMSPESGHEEFIEVDVMLSSPERMPVATQYQYMLVHSDTTPSEDEGEIDVTGE